MIARGHHKSLDNPPNIPLIMGGGSRRDELSEVIVTATKAASQYLTLSTKSSDSTSGSYETIPHPATGVSPSTKAKISGMYLSQLKSLHKLRVQC